MLSLKGDTVTVFMPDDKVADFEISMQGKLRVVLFNSNRNKLGAYLGYTARLSYEFAAILKEFIRKEGKPDFIESQEYLAIPYYLLQFKLTGCPEFQQVPVILVLHSPAFLYLYYNREGVYEFPNYWTGEMEISCIQSADHVLAPSAYIVEEIKKHVPVNEKKITVLRNPFRNENALTKAPDFVRNKIVFYGKLSPQKGVFEMLTYFRKMWDEGFPHPLYVVGGTDKVYYPEMKTMGQLFTDWYAPYIEKGLLHFVGRIQPSEKDKILSDAHVILIPSANDNLPYAAIEAMALGKLVLASVQGGQAEIIEEDNTGYLFDHAVPSAFESKLKQVLELSDSKIRSVGTNAAAAISKQLSYEQIYTEKKQLLSQIAQNREIPTLFPFARTIGKEQMVKADPDKSLLSVVIPYYNMGDYIDECIHSVLNCDYTNLEILIVNDGSTSEDSIEALKKFEANARIRVLHKRNGGLAETRNFGASHANGVFLAFLDADDIVRNDYYTKAVHVLSQYDNVSFVGSWVKYFGNKKDIWPTWNPEPPYILLHNSVNSSALVYKKQAFLAAGLNDKKVDYGLEDYGHVIGLLANGYRGVVIPETLFHYRIRSNSMYRGLTRYKALYSHEYVSGKYPELYRMYASDIFNLMNANGPSFAYDNPTFAMKVSSRQQSDNGIVSNLKTFVKRNPALKKILLQARAFIKL
jgi:glycosyltransferase involved in cell wall biosynthesis